MLKIPFAAAEAVFALIWLVCRIAVWIRRGQIDWKREALLLLMYVNLAVILRFTFFPMFRINGKVQPLIFNAAALFPFKINLIPFVRLFDYVSKKEMLLNVIGNVALFIPSGIVFPILYRNLNSFWKVLGAGALLSLCIEILQLSFSRRASDIDDLILNTLGVAIGYAVFALIRGRKKICG